MAAFMKPYTAQSYALLRIITGAMFLSHGCQKLFGWPGVPPADAPTFICSGTMAAAYWMAHGFNHLLPILNHGELAVLYCFVFLYIATNGSGMWSVDAARGDA
jgi:putative oxidoreductase